MLASDGAPELGFNERLRAFTQEIEYREAVIDTERENIYKPRYVSYQRAGMLHPGAPEYFKDPYDQTENGKTFGLYLESRLAASIRVHIASQRLPIAPALTVYSDYLQPLLDKSKIIVDPTRHVVDATERRRFPKLPYATVRVAWMACEHYGADYVLATIHEAHQAFYWRIFGRTMASEARLYPGIAKPVFLLVWDYRQVRDRVHSRYPYLTSTENERQAIFGSMSGFVGVKRAASSNAASHGAMDALGVKQI
jgi:hypothetical protein